MIKYINLKFIRWFIVGTLTFLIDYFFFILLINTIHELFISNFISTVVSSSFNYYAHHSWTFKSIKSFNSSFYCYIIFYIIFYLINTIIIKILLIYFSPELAKIISIIILAPISHHIMRRIVF